MEKLATLGVSNNQYSQISKKTTQHRTSKRSEIEYPYNMLCKAFDISEEEARNLPGIYFLDESLKYIFATLRETETDTLLLYFKYGLTIPEIAKRRDYSSGRIAQILAKALRKLRGASRYKFITRGPGQYDVYDRERTERLMEHARIKLSSPDSTPLDALDLSKYSVVTLSKIKIDTIGTLKGKYFNNELERFISYYVDLACELRKKLSTGIRRTEIKKRMGK